MATLLMLRVSPSASRDAIGNWYGQALKCSVTAAPERGQANNAVIKLLSRQWGLPKSALKIVRGDTRQDKLLRVEMPVAELQKMLNAPDSALSSAPD